MVRWPAILILALHHIFPGRIQERGLILGIPEDTVCIIDDMVVTRSISNPLRPIRDNYSSIWRISCLHRQRNWPPDVRLQPRVWSFSINYSCGHPPGKIGTRPRAWRTVANHNSRLGHAQAFAAAAMLRCHVTKPLIIWMKALKIYPVKL